MSIPFSRGYLNLVRILVRHIGIQVRASVSLFLCQLICRFLRYLDETG